MPRMKVTATGQAPEEIVIMSWSPKMDLLAIGNRKGVIQLHRLSWQKVWQISLTFRGEPAVPELMAWHPEGHFLVISSGGYTFVVDVECGKVIHNHELPVTISSMKWCTSRFHLNLIDIHQAQSKQQPDYLRNDLKMQRLETNLSVLFLGTVNGYIYAYTGGFLLALCLHIYEEGSTCQVLEMDASPSLEDFQFLTDEEAGPDEMVLSFSHFRNEYIPRVASIIGPLGHKYILFTKNWNIIQAEITSLNEHWSRLVDLYQNYMTFGATKELEICRVDYLELLLTGITCVEMELFLGDGGREKEAKKNTNAINSANASITEHLRTIKCSIVNLLTDVNEIGGFLKQISGYEEANNLMIELRKSCNYLFLAVLHIQALVHNFVEVTLHFMHMIMNTIHSFNVQEVPDFIEEDADTDKVLEFLETSVDKDIFQFLLKNVTLGCSVGDSGRKKRASPFGEISFPETNAIGVAASECETRDFNCIPDLIHNLLKKHGNGEKHPILMDFTDVEMKEFICNLIPTMAKLSDKLLTIPVLCSVPFEAETHQLTRLSKSQYMESSSGNSESKDSATSQQRAVRKSFQMTMDAKSSKTIISCLWSSRKLLFFDVEFSNLSRINVKSMTLNFSRNICAAKMFIPSYVTVASYEDSSSKELQESSRTILCHVQFQNFLNRVSSIEINLLKSKCGGKSALPTGFPIDIPVDELKPCIPLNNPHIDYVLPIEGFTPCQLEVSGLRKVGSLLADNRRTVILLEMGTNLGETSYDDTAEVSDSEESNSNYADDEED